jgi:hypothetical protein
MKVAANGDNSNCRSYCCELSRTLEEALEIRKKSKVI